MLGGGKGPGARAGGGGEQSHIYIKIVHKKHKWKTVCISVFLECNCFSITNHFMYPYK